VRKLLSIGIVLALLVTFIVPVVVAAQDDCCEWTPPAAVPMPDRTTKTLAGATMWTLLGAVVGAFLPAYSDLGDALAGFLDQIAEALQGTTGG
jgi:hypothetical protein